MKPIKKILLLLAVVLLLFSLSGCSNAVFYNPFETTEPSFVPFSSTEEMLTVFSESATMDDSEVSVSLAGAPQWSVQYYWDKEFVPILHTPTGYTLKQCLFFGEGGFWYIFHPSTCSGELQCDCQHGLQVMPRPEGLAYECTNAWDVAALAQVFLTAEQIPLSQIADDGSAVLSPFYLPLLPMRLLRLLLGELVKAAFAFGIGWIVVLFAKRRKKTPAAD